MDTVVGRVRPPATLLEDLTGFRAATERRVLTYQVTRRGVPLCSDTNALKGIWSLSRKMCIAMEYALIMIAARGDNKMVVVVTLVTPIPVVLAVVVIRRRVATPACAMMASMKPLPPEDLPRAPR